MVRKNNCLFYAALLWLAIWGGIPPGFGQETTSFSYRIDQVQDEYTGLDVYLLILPEDERTYNVGEVAGQDASVFMGYQAYLRKQPLAEAYWTKLTLENLVDQDLELMYFPGDRFTNFVEVYVPERGGFTRLQDGLYMAQEEKSMPYNRNEIAVPIRIPANQTLTLYSRIRNTDGHPVKFRAHLVRQSTWQQSNSTLHWWQGLFHGILFLFAAFYFVLFLFLRKLHFLFYVAYVLVASLYFLNYHGITTEFFFGQYPHSYIVLYLITTSLMPVFYLQFQRNFLDTYNTLPIWDILMRVLIFVRVAEALGMVLIILANFNFEFVQRVHRGFVYVESLGFLTIMYGFWVTGRTTARFIVVGSLLLHLGLVASIISHQIFHYSQANHFFQIGILLEIFVFSLAQIYQLRRDQEARIKAERASQAKAEFLSTMSHEIRTPLNAVIGSTHLLIQEEPRPDQLENLSTLKHSAESLLSLVNDILDFSKIEAGKVEFVMDDLDLRSFLNATQQSFSPLAEEKNLYLKLEMDELIPETIHVDGSRLSQVLNNLISNAIKFTREGGVTIQLKLIEKLEEEVKIEFSVADTGIGIPADKQKTIFEKFTQASSSTTREFGGTGLGLAIIHNLLALQGVDITLKSEVGKGSRFTFVQSFSYDPNAVGSLSEIQSRASFEPLRHARVLLVEDNHVNVTMAKKFLRKWGLEVEVANNGQEALDMVDMTPYDLILMDLQMPVMDGYTAAIEIRKFSKELPIIALTASALNEVREKVFRSGMDDFVTKPFNPNDLYRKVRKHLVQQPSINIES